MISTPSMKDTEPLYAQYGFSQNQWYSIARLNDRVEAAGVILNSFGKLRHDDARAGCEIVYCRAKKVIVLGVSSNGKATVAFHRTLDSAIPERVCAGDLTNWNALASQMLYYQ